MQKFLKGFVIFRSYWNVNVYDCICILLDLEVLPLCAAFAVELNACIESAAVNRSCICSLYIFNLYVCVCLGLSMHIHPRCCSGMSCLCLCPTYSTCMRAQVRLSDSCCLSGATDRKQISMFDTEQRKKDWRCASPNI